MSEILERISKEALILSPEERVTLLKRLLISVGPNMELGVDQEWETEILDRLKQIEDGEIATVSGDSAFAQWERVARQC